MQPQSPKGLRFLFYVLILIKMLMETFLDMCYYMLKALYFWQFFSFAASAVSASLIRRSKKKSQCFSSLFTMLFSDKKELLGLYNAVSGKQYKDPGALSVNTLENAIYMAIKNDLSFVIDSRPSLYEHQSTYSPNLPLRMLLYLADLYADLTKNENLYGRKKVKLPPPQFIIFYNGEEKQPA